MAVLKIAMQRFYTGKPGATAGRCDIHFTAKVMTLGGFDFDDALACWLINAVNFIGVLFCRFPMRFAKANGGISSLLELGDFSFDIADDVALTGT